jgi:hypothetical protein
MKTMATEYDWPRIRELPVHEQVPFWTLLHGQTRPLVEGLPFEEQDFFYPWDYDSWKAGKPNTD